MSLIQYAPILGAGNGDRLIPPIGNVSLNLSSLFGKKPKDPATSVVDPFSLSAFQATMRSDGMRMARGYHYKVHMSVPDAPTNAVLTFLAAKVTVPGWRAKTQMGKIYGLPYEIATGLEQDPVWMTFNIDIRHKTDHYFLNIIKARMFDSTDPLTGSYSPDYKENMQFEMGVIVTDENFQPLYEFNLENAIVKTVQNINYGSAELEYVTVTVEIVYEKVQVKEYNNTRKEASQNPAPVDKNKFTLGPFSADISQLNTVVSNVSNIPSWFTGATPLKI